MNYSADIIDAKVCLSSPYGGCWHVVSRRSGVWLVWDVRDTKGAWVGPGESLTGWRLATEQEVDEIDAARREAGVTG